MNTNTPRKDKTMKRKIFVLAAVVMGIGLYPLVGQSQMMGPGYGGGPGGNPMIGQGFNCGGGGSMMGYGYGNAPQYGPQPQYQEPSRPIDEKEARTILENYVRSTKNPNLKLGNIEEKGNTFEGEIVTKKEGALVDRLAVDKYTGRMRSVY